MPALTESLPAAPAAARLDGRVVLLTGADGAAGRPIAAALAALGADVVLVHRSGHPDVVAATAAAVPVAGEVVADTSEPAGAAAAFDAAIDRCGRVDVLVHLPGRAVKKPVAALSDEEWRTGVRANLDSAFFVAREAARRLADGGRIILLSTSLTAVTVGGYASYAPFKAGVEHLVRALAKEVGGRGITANAVAPGPIDSPFVHDQESDEHVLAHLRAMSVANRLGTWEDVAPVIAFLASPAAQWVTAQTIRVNGGFAA